METRPSAPPVLRVTVAFALSPKPPFRSAFPESALALEVRLAAMRHFEVAEDPNQIYYLTHERQRVDDTKALSAIAGDARAIEFRLNKELIQG